MDKNSPKKKTIKRKRNFDIQDMPTDIKDYLFKRWMGCGNDCWKEFVILDESGTMEDKVIQWFKDNGATNPEGVLVKVWW